MNIFELDTPKNIADMSEEEILALCSSYGDVRPVKTRAKVVKLIYKEILKFDLSKDLFYVLVDESKEVLVIAPAGGGKTTTMAVKVALEKIYRKSKFTNSGKMPGDRVLSLVYTRDNVKDVIDRHTELVSKLNALGVDSLMIDYDLNCCTTHSFCLRWIKQPEYSSFLGISGFETIADETQMSIVDSLISKICEKRGVELPKNFKSTAFVGLYNYLAETYKTLEEVSNSNIFLDLGLPIDIVDELILRYDKRKKLIRKMDRTDYLTYFKKLMETNEEARKRIQEYYDYIVADEVQDFTPLLKDILKSIVGEHTVLSCIGDDDQAIYGFRGADYRNALNFKEIFPSSKVLSLATNRRCPSNILSMANSVISLNSSRYDKVMTGLKGPGEISFNGYNDRIGQYMAIVALLKSMSSEELSNTIIGSRENLFSLPLSILMYKSNIDFYTSKGYGPFDYGLFISVTKVMNAITSGGSKRALVELYRILPISKKEMCEALHYDPIKGEFLDGKSYVDIDKIDFNPSRMSNPRFVTLYKNIIYLSRNYETLECRKYMTGFIDMVKKYYWNFISQSNKMPVEISEFCEDFYVDLFNTSKTYKEKLAEILEYKDRMKDNIKNKRGVMLSAFHSMKGLEADNIILCDLAESIFPNFSGIDFRPYDAETKKDLKEEETRLCYVALTRSKKNLWLFYSKNDPSYYISYLMDSSKDNAKFSSSVYGDDYSPSPKIPSMLSDSSLFSTPSTVDVNEGNVNTGIANTSQTTDTSLAGPSKVSTSYSDEEVEIEIDEVDLEDTSSNASATDSSDGLSNVSSHVKIQDSVDDKFIESGEVAITKSHDLEGVSVTAKSVTTKSVNSSYRNNVFNSLFNNKK